MTEQRAPSDAVLTIPNLLTFLRLALTPIYLWLALGPDRVDLAVAVATVAFLTDLADGKIARRYGQISRLGVLLDPLADRLALAAGAAVLIGTKLAPLGVVLAVLIRDALLLVVAPVLKAKRIPLPPVSKVGKIGSFLVSASFVLYVASGVADVAHPQRWLSIPATILFIAGIPLYYAAAFGYAREALRSIRASGARG